MGKSEQVNREVEQELDQAERAGILARGKTRAMASRFLRRAKCGQLVEPMPGFFARATSWENLKPHIRHAVMVRSYATEHPETLFSSYSAGVMYGMEVPWRVLGSLHAASTAANRVNRSKLFVRDCIGEDDAWQSGEVRLTSPLRTALDCMCRLRFGEALAVADAALRRGYFSQDDLVDYVDAQGRMVGIGQARMVARMADPRPENGGESIARARMYELGFVMPDLQFEVTDKVGHKEYRADFHWKIDDEHQIFGELDGGEKYVDPEMTGGADATDVMRAERRRESRISSKGSVMRFSYEEVWDTAFFVQLLDEFGVPHATEAPVFELPPQRKAA